MRKLLSLLLVALFVMPIAVFAQDEESNTIADIVVASTEAEEAEFTTLLTAVQAADESVLETLADPEAELTVFAPTDAAFAALAEALGEEEFNAVLEDTALLTDILLYHVVPGTVMSEDVVAALDENMDEFSTQTAQGQFIDIAGNVEDGITIDGANLVLELVDIEADNGVIHVIDAVILPETRTIAEIVVANTEAEEPEFITLFTAVGLADPAVLELLSDPEAELTVFAPTDAGFAALAEALGEEDFNAILGDTPALTDILQYHVIAGVFYEADVAGLLDEEGMAEVEMANGDMATVEATDEGIFIDGAQIIVTDIEAANGVIHVIDAVMVPPEDVEEE
jgi:transforming growth factor-beta-induced protein